MKGKEKGQGHCKHGTFDLVEGCPQCVADRMGAQGNTAASIAEEIKKVEPVGRHYGLAPEPLSEEARRVITGGRDEMIVAATSPETALALRPGEDIEVRGYFQEALKLLAWAQGRVIATVDDLKFASDDLIEIGKLKKLMENKRKFLLEPLEAQKVAIRETYTYLMTPVLEADKITCGKMLNFNNEQRRIRQEQEEINRKRQEAAEAEMRLKGELSESVNLVEVAPEPAKSVSTDLGSSGMVDHWKYEVFDFALLPDAYKMEDNAQLNAIAKRHHDQKPVPGVRFYNEPIIARRARL